MNPSPLELLLQRDVVHVVGAQASRDEADFVARRGEALAVVSPLVAHRPRPPSEHSREVGRVARHIDELLAVGGIVAVALFALVDRGREGIVGRQRQAPLVPHAHFGLAHQFRAVAVYPFQIGRLPVSPGIGCPENPVVDVGVEGREVELERKCLPLDGAFQAAVVGEAPFGLQVGVASGLEVEVVHRGITIVAGYGSLQHKALAARLRSFLSEQVKFSKEGRDQGNQVASINLLAQYGGER